MKVIYQEDVEVVNKKNTLDGIVLATSQAKEELAEVTKTKKETVKEIKDLESQLSTAKTTLEKELSVIANLKGESTDELNSLLAEVNEKRVVLKELNAEISEIENILSIKKNSIDEDIAKYTRDNSSELDSINNEIASKRKDLAKLVEDVETLSSTKASLATQYSEMKEFVDVAENKVKELESLAKDVSESLEKNTRASFEATNTTANKEKEYKELVSKMETLSHELAASQMQKSELDAERAAISHEREELSREKLAFQTERSNIALREQFIIEKYELAGVPYK